jgi:hypothetical protein
MDHNRNENNSEQSPLCKAIITATLTIIAGTCITLGLVYQSPALIIIGALIVMLTLVYAISQMSDVNEFPPDRIAGIAARAERKGSTRPPSEEDETERVQKTFDEIFLETQV